MKPRPLSHFNPPSGHLGRKRITSRRGSYSAPRRVGTGQLVQSSLARKQAETLWTRRGTNFHGPLADDRRGGSARLPADRALIDGPAKLAVGERRGEANPVAPWLTTGGVLALDKCSCLVVAATAQSLTPASPDDLASVLAFALRFHGRKRTHNADENMSEVVAHRLVEHLERAGFVVMKRPPIGGGAAASHWPARSPSRSRAERGASGRRGGIGRGRTASPAPNRSASA
jgi:hypothetical protein